MVICVSVVFPLKTISTFITPTPKLAVFAIFKYMKYRPNVVRGLNIYIHVLATLQKRNEFHRTLVYQGILKKPEEAQILSSLHFS